MNLWIYKILFLVAFATISLASDCPDIRCFITKNEKNENVFDCSSRETTAWIIIKCTYHSNNKKIILTTSNSEYLPIRSIAVGAFSRLVSAMAVDKIYIKKLQFKSLDKDDFNGLINISEMRIENPETLASDTFLSLAKRSSYFILTISCTGGNLDNSFHSLILKSQMWRLYTHSCKNEYSCQFSNCDTQSEDTMFRISSSGKPATTAYSIAFQACSMSSSCIDNQLTKTSFSTSKIVSSTEVVKTALLKVVSEPKVQEYNSFLYVIVVLMSGNTVIIIGIIVFLIFWWSKHSTSTTNNKHTIILEDEDDMKYEDETAYPT